MIDALKQDSIEPLQNDTAVGFRSIRADDKGLQPRSLSEPGIRIDLQTALSTQKTLTGVELNAMTGINFENVERG